MHYNRRLLRQKVGREKKEECVQSGKFHVRQENIVAGFGCCLGLVTQPKLNMLNRFHGKGRKQRMENQSGKNDDPPYISRGRRNTKAVILHYLPYFINVINLLTAIPPASNLYTYTPLGRFPALN